MILCLGETHRPWRLSGAACLRSINRDIHTDFSGIALGALDSMHLTTDNSLCSSLNHPLKLTLLKVFFIPNIEIEFHHKMIQLTQFALMRRTLVLSMDVY
jgi:hypothetical protein